MLVQIWGYRLESKILDLEIYLYLAEKVTIRYRNGQIKFALKMLGENHIDLHIHGDRNISIEGLLDKCNGCCPVFVTKC
jgi:hypothetical protein